MAAPTIPATARAAVLYELKKDYAIKDDHPVPKPDDLAPGECLIKLDYSGVCHSDLHIQRGEWAQDAALPIIGGHEGVGHIVAIGKHSNPGPIKIGDRVGAKWVADVCMKCEMCRKGHESSCEVSFKKVHGYTQDGTFAQYVVSYLDYVTPIPDELDSAAAAPILCGGLTVYKALKQANARIGEWVAISGAGGGLGHLAVQYAAAMGLRVLAIDTGAVKKELVFKLGAEKWVDFRESKDLIADIKAATDGLGPHAAVIAAGDPRPFNQAIDYLRRAGTLVCVGLPGGEAILKASIPSLILKSLTVKGSAIGNRQDVAEALQIAAQGKVKCQYQVRDLSELNQVFSDMEAARYAGRTVLKL